jgi:hypothetical protein
MIGKLIDLSFQPYLTLIRVFNERKSWIDIARNYCEMFTWGGRTEQEMARKLRGGNELYAT